MFVMMCEKFPGGFYSPVTRCKIGKSALLFAQMSAEFSQLRVSKRAHLSPIHDLCVKTHGGLVLEGCSSQEKAFYRKPIINLGYHHSPMLRPGQAHLR